MNRIQEAVSKQKNESASFLCYLANLNYFLSLDNVAVENFLKLQSNLLNYYYYIYNSLKSYLKEYLQLMRFSFLLIIILALSSCTFEPEGLNFVDIDKPAPTHPLTVTLSNETDSIYLYGDTRINFTLSTFGKKLNYAEIKYYNNIIKVNQPVYSFIITPQDRNAWSDLTIDFYVHTGSGSLADQLKAENYILSRTWKIKHIDLSTEGLQTGYQIHPEGYLELFIVSPKQKTGGEYGMSKYGNSIPVSRVSNDTVFFADKSYLGDLRTYNIWYKPNQTEIYSRNIVVNIPNVELNIEAAGIDSCLVSWTKSPLKLYYVLNDGVYKGFDNQYKTSILVGENEYFSLTVYPPDYTNSTYLKYNIWVNFGLGIYLRYFYCYSVEKDKFFIPQNTLLTKLESLSLPLPERDSNALETSNAKLQGSPNGNYITCYLNNQIYVYNSQLELIRTIDTGKIPNYYPYYNVTNDGVFTYLHGANVFMKNLSGTSWETFNFSSDFDPDPNTIYLCGIANTIDGKYICMRGLNGFWIYDVSDHLNAQVAFNLPSDEVRAVLAHPTNPGRIFVKRLGKIEERTCPEFELIQTITVPFTDYYVLSIDPFSKIILLMKDNYYYFVNPETSEIVFQLKSPRNNDYKVSLIRNLFRRNGFVVDLSKYL